MGEPSGVRELVDEIAQAPMTSPAIRALVDEIDAALQAHGPPDRTPLTEQAKAMIADSVASSPPMTEQQCRRIGRLLARHLNDHA